jgi:hypothetical protein
MQGRGTGPRALPACVIFGFFAGKCSIKKPCRERPRAGLAAQ